MPQCLIVMFFPTVGVNVRGEVIRFGCQQCAPPTPYLVVARSERPMGYSKLSSSLWTFRHPHHRGCSCTPVASHSPAGWANSTSVRQWTHCSNVIWQWAPHLPRSHRACAHLPWWSHHTGEVDSVPYPPSPLGVTIRFTSMRALSK